jgi:uncharacterized protein YndB with AHSA1/START domain
MPTITTTIDIKSTPDDVWAVLSDMPATRQWLPGVVAARMAGDIRVCQMADGQQVHETISDISAEQRSFRFEHIQVPLPVRRSGGTFTVTAGSDPQTTTVTLRTTFEPLDQAASTSSPALSTARFSNRWNRCAVSSRTRSPGMPAERCWNNGETTSRAACRCRHTRSVGSRPRRPPADTSDRQHQRNTVHRSTATICSPTGGVPSCRRARTEHEPVPDHWHSYTVGRTFSFESRSSTRGRICRTRLLNLRQLAPASEFRDTTSRVCCSSLVGLNSTTSEPACRNGVCPGRA